MEFYKYKNFLLVILFLLCSKILKTKNSTPKLSIFLPIFNMQDYLEETLNLLLKQTLKNIEIIAVNDFSNDRTYEILKEFA